VNNKVITNMIKAEYDYESVYNGIEALHAMCNSKFEVVLMDIQMPLMDGLETTKEARRRGVTTPVIAVTASVDQHNFDQCIAAGMNDFLGKPITKLRVLEMIKKWLNK